MEKGSSTDQPSAATSTGILDLVDEEFKNVHDSPFVTVNRIDGQYLAEVFLCGDEAVDQARIQTALDVGYSFGVHSYAIVYNDIAYEGCDDSVRIHFTPDSIPDDIGGMWPR